MHSPSSQFDQFCRRQFLGKIGGMGLGAAALGMLLSDDARAAEPVRTDALASRKPHHIARATSIIYLHMIGGPSQLDMFDPKPELVRRDGQACPEELVKGKRFAFIGDSMILSGSPYRFAPRGKSGQAMSELLPHLAGVADELTFVHSVQTDEINHAPAQLFLRSGFGRGGRPGVGSWVTYGLGSESKDLPGYVVMLSGALGGAGTSLWSSGFLPSVYQGVQFRSSGDPVLFLSNPKGHDSADRKRVLDAVRALDESHLGEVKDPEIATRIKQYELAFRMQTSVPELTDLSKESAETLKLYGVEPGKPSFAGNCLLARRLVERGVRVVELYDANWDHHNDIATRMPDKCRDVDQGMAALVTDLKRKGLLDKTLIVWGGEFGRTPLRQAINGDGTTVNPGRDHNKDAFTMWLAGGGVKAGSSFGKTDEFGFEVTENAVSVHDLNATILHLLGLNHEKLTYKYQGREFRLTDVFGRPMKDILA